MAGTPTVTVSIRKSHADTVAEIERLAEDEGVSFSTKLLDLAAQGLAQAHQRQTFEQAVLQDLAAIRQALANGVISIAQPGPVQAQSTGRQRKGKQALLDALS